MFFRRAALCLLLLAGTCSITQADENPGDWFSDDAIIVVRVRQPKATMAKVVSFVYSAAPMYTPLLLSNESDILEFTNEPLFKATDLDHDFWWAMFNDEAGEAVSAFIVRTRDDDEVINELNELIADDASESVLRHGRYVIIATAQPTLDQIQKRIDGQGTSWRESISPEQKKTFETGDLSVHVNTRHVYDIVRKNADDDVVAHKEFRNSLTQMLFNAYDEEAVLKFVSREILEKGADAIVGAAGVAISATVDHTGIETEILIDHDLDRENVKQKPHALSNFQVLHRMPPDRQCYVAGTAPIPSPAGWFLNVIDVDNHDDKDAPTLTEQGKIQRRLRKLKYGQWSVAFSLPTITLPEFRLDEVAEIENPQAHRLMNNNLAIIQTQFKEFREKRAYELLDGVEQFGDRTADIHRITYKKSDEENEDTHAKIYGSNGLVSRCVYEGNLFVNTIGGGIQAMQEALQRTHATDIANLRPGLAATRTKLPENSSFILLLDAASVFASLTQLDEGVANHEGKLGEIVDLGIKMAKPTQSFCGVAFALESEQARLNLYVPIEQLRTNSPFFFMMFAGEFL
ncbi:hypothetical protein Mal52_12900 [Symmachiella dynata]|uniref:Uncharacterized protein n=2 Tax=Symmachiella dynata TaxID=2527995 RepID=A0A517ZK01_9PLAN|nr:hypothetical protein Mal52_12900 [Symmachiella dynata]